jgi:hypothetical protein
MSSSALTVSQLTFNQIYKTFDPYLPTIFSGPGYYFKYTPANTLTDDTTVASLSTNNDSSVILIFFNSTTDSTLKRITGTTYLFLNNKVSQLNLKLKKINFLGNNENYIIISNGNQLSLSISSDSDGFVTISNITTSVSASINSYFVSSLAGSSVADSFNSERIENLIYRVAFIYILVFLFLYLTLLPFCALFDCVDNKSLKRKIKISEQESYQGIKHRSESEVED